MHSSFSFFSRFYFSLLSQELSSIIRIQIKFCYCKCIMLSQNSFSYGSESIRNILYSVYINGSIILFCIFLFSHIKLQSVTKLLIIIYMEKKKKKIVSEYLLKQNILEHKKMPEGGQKGRIQMVMDNKTYWNLWYTKGLLCMELCKYISVAMLAHEVKGSSILKVQQKYSLLLFHFHITFSWNL